MITFYTYKNCSTCQKTKKLLQEKAVPFEEVGIIENPPQKQVLKEILNSTEYELKHLFNRSGQLYREMNMKEKINELSQSELLGMLSQYGKLIKRPILVKGKQYVVGYDERKIKELCG